jgi:MFS family permease
MNRFRRLLIRWEEKLENYVAMWHFACTCITYRAAGLFAEVLSIIRDKFPQEKLAVAQGIFSSMFLAGALIGVAIGGTIRGYDPYKS